MTPRALFLASLFLFFLALPARVAAQCWEQQYLPATGPDLLYDVVMFKDERGWAAGSQLIAKTTNLGQTWEQVNYPDPNPGGFHWIEGVYFVNGDTGWVVGQPNLILKTTNGGQSWTSQGGGLQGAFKRPQFVNEQIGWIYDFVYPHRVLKTEDGGANWKELSFPCSVVDDYYFLDSNIGWASGNGLFLKTFDGGNTWNTIHQGWPTAHRSIFFLNEKNGWGVAGTSVVVKTMDGGTTWQSKYTADCSEVSDITFVSPYEGMMIVGCNGYDIYLTSDGGETWHEQFLNLLPGYLSGVFYQKANEAWAVGGDGKNMHYTAPTAEITPINSTDFCHMNSIRLAASIGTGYAFQWKKDGVDIIGATSETYLSTVSGSYTVATTQNGCTATSAPTIVTIGPLPLANLAATICPGTTYFFNGQDLRWSDFAGQKSILTLSHGKTTTTTTTTTTHDTGQARRVKAVAQEIRC